jgi:hypothetical protein
MQTELLEAEEIPAWAPRVHSPLHDPALITLCLYKIVLVLHTPVLSATPHNQQTRSFFSVRCYESIHISPGLNPFLVVYEISNYILFMQSIMDQAAPFQPNRSQASIQ